jgi:hypothetical protein
MIVADVQRRSAGVASQHVLAACLFGLYTYCSWLFEVSRDPHLIPWCLFIVALFVGPCIGSTVDQASESNGRQLPCHLALTQVVLLTMY